jgi:hypothetical protein
LSVPAEGVAEIAETSRRVFRRSPWGTFVGILWWPTVYVSFAGICFAFASLGSRQEWWQIPVGLVVPVVAGISQVRTRIEIAGDELRVVNGLRRMISVSHRDVARVGIGMVPGGVRSEPGVVLELTDKRMVPLLVSRVTSRWRRRQLRDAFVAWASPHHVPVNLSPDVNWTWKPANAVQNPRASLTKVQRRRLVLVTGGVVVFTVAVVVIFGYLA